MSLEGLDETGFLDSDTALDSERFPRSVIVLGGGAIALEFAHFYNALGIEVTVLQRSNQVIKEADPDIAEALVAAFRKRGIRVICGTKLTRVERTATGKSVWYERNGKEQVAEAEEIFYALGRKPAIEGLGLEKAGVETNKKKAVIVNSGCKHRSRISLLPGTLPGFSKLCTSQFSKGRWQPGTRRNCWRVKT